MNIALEGKSNKKPPPLVRGRRVKGVWGILYTLHLFIVFALVSISSFAFAEEPVFRDVPNLQPIWCGNSFYFASSRGLYSFNTDSIKPKLSRVLRSKFIMPAGCSHDARWLIYLDKKSVRYDKGTNESGVVDAWRYRLHDGFKQKFAIVKDGGAEAVPAPNKDAIFIGYPPKASIKMPQPIWKIFSSKNQFTTRTIWLKDASAVVTTSEEKLFMEKIADGSLVYFENQYQTIWSFKALPSNEILLRATPERKIAQKEESVLRICYPSAPSKCEDYVGAEFNPTDFDISSSGDVFFTSGSLNCIAKVTHKGDSPKCIYPGTGDNLAVSANGAWLAFTRAKPIGPNHIHDDLYIVQLTPLNNPLI